jgi:ribosome-associated protein
MAGDLVVKSGTVIPASELAWKFSRSSGPGGQSVNTTDSRVSLSLDIAATSALDEYLKARALERLSTRLVNGVLTVHAEAERSQHQNRLAAQERLAAILRSAIAPPPAKRRPTKPSRRAKERRIAGKKQRGETKRLRRSLDD